MKRNRLLLLALLSTATASTLAACAAQPDAEEEGATEDHLLSDHRTPDENNLWTKGVDLSKMKIGEETVLPNEEAMFDGFAKDVRDMQDRLATVNGKVMRGFHAKSHACLLGELRVNTAKLPASARVGLFAHDQNYPTWVRYSNGTGFVQADRKGDVRGVGIKVMNVVSKDPKILASAANAVTQDFLMTNGPITPASDARQFVAFGKALTDARVTPGGEEVGAIEGLLKTGGYLLKSENSRVRSYLVEKALPRVLTKGSLEGEQFWSGGAFAMGLGAAAAKDPMHAPAVAAAKMTALPGILKNGVCQSVRDVPAIFDKDYLRIDIKDRIRKDETCLDIQIQLQNDPAKQPMEDTSIEWRADEAPFVSVGYIYIPVTNLDDPTTQKKEAFCNDLAFTPWHALREHRPLGNIMRARLKVYEGSHEHRNGSAEPTGKETF